MKRNDGHAPGYARGYHAKYKAELEDIQLALHDSRPFARVWAVRELFQWAGTNSRTEKPIVRALLEEAASLLNDPDDDVRYYAIDLFHQTEVGGVVGYENAMDLVVLGLNDPSFVNRKAAIKALDWRVCVRHVDKIALRALHDENADVRHQAITTLKRLNKVLPARVGYGLMTMREAKKVDRFIGEVLAKVT